MPTNWFDELTPIGGRHPIKFPFAINYEVILAPRQRAVFRFSSLRRVASECEMEL